MSEKKAFHEQVAEKLIKQLEAGTAPWQKPWQPGEQTGFIPFNPTTGNRYKGINAVQLMSEGYDDPRWMTYNQAQDAGAQVRRGEKSTSIQYWKFTEEQTKRDDKGKPVLDAEGKPVKEIVQLERPKVFFASVFNAQQIDGLPPLEVKDRKEQQWGLIERAEHILEASGATIRHGGDRAFYRSSTDMIQLPHKEQFESADRYYATALHELGHWTGHHSRLDRDLANPFGSEAYAKEELRAEIASMILGDELGIGHDPGQHAAYVGSWIKALKDDPLEIFRAAADAEKIQNYVLAFEQKQIQEQVNTQDKTQELEQRIDEATQSLKQSYPGYDEENPSISWQTLKATAEKHGLTAVLSESPDPHVDLDVTYKFGDKALPVNTELLLGDGKAATYAAGQRVEGTYFTAEPTWQAAALERGLDKAFYQEVFSVLKENFDARPQVFQLADDPEVYGEKAGHWLVVSSDMNEELSGPISDQTTAEQQCSYIQIIGAAIAAVEDGQLPHQAISRLTGYEMPGDWDGSAIVQPVDADHAVVVGSGAGQQVIAAFSNAADAELVAQSLVGANQFAKSLHTQQEHAISSRAEETPDMEQSSVVKLALAYADLQSDLISNDELNRVVTQTIGQPAAIQDAKNWTGATEVRGCESVIHDGEKFVEEVPEERAEFFAVYLQQTDGKKLWSADFPAKEQAQNHAQLLESVYSMSQLMTAKKSEAQSVEFAQDREQQVLNNESSTAEDISAAKMLRENAESSTRSTDQDQKQQEQQAQDTQKIYVSIPYSERAEARSLGADFDKEAKSWFVPSGVDPAPILAKWPEKSLEEKAPPPQKQEAPQQDKRIYLAVPFSEKNEAKAQGAKWDGKAKSWYASADSDLTKLQPWLPKNNTPAQAPAMSLRDEVIAAMADIGLVASGEHPILDGKAHRCSVEGDKPGQHSGFYRIHTDQHPAGFMQNHKTQERQNWSSKGYTLSDEEKATLQAERAEKLQQREAEQLATYEKTAGRVESQLKNLVPVVNQTPYMQEKGITPQPGLFTDKEGQKTYIPASDVNGKHWTTQYINEDGVKRFAKDSRKEGCLCVVGGVMSDLKKAPAIIVGEGYATANSVSKAMGFATVAAFDSGNLNSVVTALHQAYPDKPIVVAGDDDTHQEKNPGRKKAEEAAATVQGKAVFPIFAPGEREANPRGFTDFNDLEMKSSLGLEAVKRQVSVAVEQAVAQTEARQQSLKQEQQQQQQQQQRRQGVKIS